MYKSQETTVGSKGVGYRTLDTANGELEISGTRYHDLHCLATWPRSFPGCLSHSVHCGTNGMTRMFVQVEVIEKGESERRSVDDKKRKEEVDFLKYQGQHLDSFLKQIGGTK